jgi:hypothetical protein
VRGTDGSPAVRLGDAIGMAFSPDEKWVLGVPQHDVGALVLLPVGAGSPRPLKLPGHEVHFAGWFPDGRSLWLSSNLPGEALRLHRFDLDSERITPIGSPGIGAIECRATPDGRFMLAPGTDQIYRLYPVDGGDPIAVPGMLPNDRPTGWAPDGRRLFVYERGPVPARAFILDPDTGEREPWRLIGPSDPSGVFTLAPLRIAADANSYAISYGRVLIDLFEVRGLG